MGFRSRAAGGTRRCPGKFSGTAPGPRRRPHSSPFAASWPHDDADPVMSLNFVSSCTNTRRIALALGTVLAFDEIFTRAFLPPAAELPKTVS
jgi:hypothetical protein